MGIDSNFDIGNQISAQRAIALGQVHSKQDAKEFDLSEPQIRSLERAGKIECETCKNRKYQDGSDEMVSFKSAAHISPDAAASRVRGHEQEHVTNAYDKAKENDGKVIMASVSIKTAVCPECGRVYVAGGETRTSISYPEGEMGDFMKSRDRDALVGMNYDERI